MTSRYYTYIMDETQPITTGMQPGTFYQLISPIRGASGVSRMSIFEQIYFEYMYGGSLSTYVYQIEKTIRKGILKLKAKNARYTIGDNFYEQIQYYDTSRFKGWIRKIINKGCIPRSTGYINKVMERLEARAKAKLDNDFKYKPNQENYYPIRHNNENRLRIGLNKSKKEIYKHNYYDKCK